MLDNQLFAEIDPQKEAAVSGGYSSGSLINYNPRGHQDGLYRPAIPDNQSNFYRLYNPHQNRDSGKYKPAI